MIQTAAAATPADVASVWYGFHGGLRERRIDVRDFIQRNDPKSVLRYF